tara:strand:+ start:79 stop:1137 length:1059 start_codon:yes stop_codon:yes gene_type:complete
LKLHQTPFEHGLALAWSDGALSRRGAQLLELLQSRLVLSDKQRAGIEEKWLQSLSNIQRRSFGDGDEALSNWLKALSNTDQLENAAKQLGRTALESGLSKSTWKKAHQFAIGLGLGEPFAKGAWLEESVSPTSDWPEALDPLAIIIGLGMGEISPKPEIKINASKNPVIVINNTEKTAVKLKWLPDLIPDTNECVWSWNGENKPIGSPPSGEFVISLVVLEAWIKRLMLQRIERGDTPLTGWPKNAQLVPSSVILQQSGIELQLEMILDLGSHGLVKPWTRIVCEQGVINTTNPPQGLDKGWKSLHEGMTKMLKSGIDTLPRQLLIAVRSTKIPGKISLTKGWFNYELTDFN